MIGSLLNQDLYIYEKTGYTREGRESLGGASTQVTGRIQVKDKRTLLPNGTMITVNAIAYLPADTTIATDYKIVYDNITYKVLTITKQIDAHGSVHHIKAELVKWQT